MPPMPASACGGVDPRGFGARSDDVRAQFARARRAFHERLVGQGFRASSTSLDNTAHARHGAQNSACKFTIARRHKASDGCVSATRFLISN
ncbi:MAG: hypothetical protein L6R19_20335 [Alphaproteobacteria bacterium]|nr:hypothetical protein [Burkholderiaceae bacterium]MCK6453172.1 hypothetical protein [Alphaproteobacteria bacterium]